MVECFLLGGIQFLVMLYFSIPQSQFHPFIELRALGEYTSAVPSLLPSPNDRLEACYDSEK